MYVSAFTIGMGYLIGGLVPLMPYFFIDQATTALVYSCVSYPIAPLPTGIYSYQLFRRF